MTPLRDGTDEAMDLIAGGGEPRRRLPRRLVIGTEVVLGVVALAWVGLTIVDNRGTPPSSRPPVLTVIGTSEPSYRPGHGEFEIELQNNSESTLYIDNLTVLNDAPVPAGVWAPSWIRTQVIDPGGFGSVSEGSLPALDVEVKGFGGAATLRVSIDPPCRDDPPPAAEIVVGYHSASGALDQIAIPEVLNAGPTVLPTMVSAACGAPADPHFVPPPVGRLRPSERYTLPVGLSPLSFSVPGHGWRNERDLYFGKSTSRGPSADAIFFVAPAEGVTKGVRVCGQWWGNPTGDVVHYATLAGNIPWVEQIKRPTATRVGGRYAATAVLRVEGEGTCQPGFLYTWPDNGEDGFWSGARSGDTVRLWIVDGGLGPFLVVEAISHPGAGSEVRREIRQIVGSIRFE